MFRSIVWSNSSLGSWTQENRWVPDIKGWAFQAVLLNRDISRERRPKSLGWAFQATATEQSALGRTFVAGLSSRFPIPMLCPLGNRSKIPFSWQNFSISLVSPGELEIVTACRAIRSGLPLKTCRPGSSCFCSHRSLQQGEKLSTWSSDQRHKLSWLHRRIKLLGNRHWASMNLKSNFSPEEKLPKEFFEDYLAL